VIARKNIRGLWSAAMAHGIEPGLLRKVVEVESSDDPEAVSPAGAVGYAQLTPIAVKEYNNRYGTDYTFEDVAEDSLLNLRVAAGILSGLRTNYGLTDLRQQLAAAVLKALEKVGEGGNWLANLPEETQNYLKKFGL
jgi:soluble lytic murein transglycosylase-like protein